MNTTETIILAATLSISLILVVFIIAKYTYLLKKALIDKGDSYVPPKNKYRYLEYGCILLGIGAGLGFSAIYTAFDLTEDAADLLIWGTILIFGGLGLLLAFNIKNKHSIE